jgi:hypothetical protein
MPPALLPRLRLLALTLLPLAATASLESTLTCSPAGPIPSVSLNSQPLFSNPPPLRVFVGGAFRTDFSLFSFANVSGIDALGAYVGVDCVYALTTAPASPFFSSSVYTYAAAAASPTSSLVRFRYGFPRGAANTNHSAGKNKQSTVANFPAFSGPALLKNIISWQDSFVAPQTKISFGMTGGPIVSYGDDVTGSVTVLTPLE